VNFTVDRYLPSTAGEWDSFVDGSRNGTFLLRRGFMDYHADRFEDHSLVVRDAADRIVALLPASRSGDEIHSHAGLTYGGFVYGPRSGAADAVSMMEAVISYMRDHGLVRLHYKTIPWIYHRQPAEDDRYALFRAGAALVRRDVLSVVPREERLRYQERRRRGAKGAAKAGVAVAESGDYQSYWAVLDQTLRDRHGVAPVHSLQEIQLLASRFPANIRLFTANLGGAVVAGALVFESHRVAHVQYIASGPDGREVGALDAVFDHLLGVVYRDKPFFDFGISNEEQGRVLNVGLLEQKEGFGARPVAHDYYLVEAGGQR
jgi:hypothetical protein